MINNLKMCSPPMHCLFLLFRDRWGLGEGLSEEDIEIASRKHVLDPRQMKLYLKNMESASEDIGHAFRRQAENAAVHLRSYL